MNLTDEKEQNQNVEPKYLDPEDGFEIRIRKDKLYKIKKKDNAKNAKIVKPVSADGFRGSESTFLDLEHQANNVTHIDDEFQGEILLIDDYLDCLMIDSDTVSSDIDEDDNPYVD